MRKTFFIMLLVALVSGGGAVTAQENQSRANPTPNNISALQVEAEQARKSCEDNLHYRRNYSCACIEANFPAARVKLGDAAPLHDLFSEVEKGCIDRTSIEKFQYEACIKSSRSSFPFLDPNGFEDYCTCVGKKSADKFIAAPFNSIKTITNYRNTSGAECGRLDLFKANSNQRPK